MQADLVHKLKAEVNVMPEVVNPELQPFESNRGCITRQNGRLELFLRVAEPENRDARHR